MDLRKLKSLIDLVSDSDISELEISEGEDRVRIVKSPDKLSTSPTPSKIDSFYSDDTASASAHEENKTHEAENQKLILSPMVGTFYRAGSPDSSPFAEVGQIIEEGQTLCVIEAMKLMNEVPTNMTGKILEIFVENGEPVEFEQPLFKIEI